MRHKKLLVVAIDPGKQGRIAYLSRKGEVLDVLKLPWTTTKKGGFLWGKRLVHLLRGSPLSSTNDTLHPVVVCEWYRPHGRNGKLTWYSAGDMFGSIRTACDIAGLPLYTVDPKEWIHECLPKSSWGDREKSKEACKILAQARWPDRSFANDNVADACMIGLYAVQKEIWRWPTPDLT